MMKLVFYPKYRKAAEVAERLNEAFPWDETPEGMRFWANVYWKLKTLAAGAVGAVRPPEGTPYDDPPLPPEGEDYAT